MATAPRIACLQYESLCIDQGISLALTCIDLQVCMEIQRTKHPFRHFVQPETGTLQRATNPATDLSVDARKQETEMAANCVEAASTA